MTESVAMIVLGIDIGVTGAIAVMDESDRRRRKEITRGATCPFQELPR
jgi:hypothetical protein